MMKYIVLHVIQDVKDVNGKKNLIVFLVGKVKKEQEEEDTEEDDELLLLLLLFVVIAVFIVFVPVIILVCDLFSFDVRVLDKAISEAGAS